MGICNPVPIGIMVLFGRVGAFLTRREPIVEGVQHSTTRLSIEQYQPQAEALPGCSPRPQPATQPRMCTIAEDFACRATDQSTCWDADVN